VIRITINETASALLRRASAEMLPAVMRNLRVTFDDQNEQTVGHIKQFRATGLGPFPVEEHRLGVKTTRYRRSIRRSKAVVTGNILVASIGSNMEYAGAHEFGFSGSVFVRGHARAQASRNVRGKIDGKRRLTAKGIAFVQGHARAMNLPARAPITTGIEDRAAAVGEAASASIITTLNGFGLS
jgi:phage gpG-like protein